MLPGNDLKLLLSYDSRVVWIEALSNLGDGSNPQCGLLVAAVVRVVKGMPTRRINDVAARRIKTPLCVV